MRLIWMALFFASLASAASAQVTRITTQRPRPLLTLGDTLTVTASPATVNFSLVPNGVATGSSPIVITTTWTGISLLSSINMYAYFSVASRALSGGVPASYIPSSCVLGQDPGGIPTTFTAFTQTNPFGGAGASLKLYSTTSVLSLGGSHTDNLSLKIDLTTLPQLPAATYQGMLLIQAQAF